MIKELKEVKRENILTVQVEQSTNSISRNKTTQIMLRERKKAYNFSLNMSKKLHVYVYREQVLLANIRAGSKYGLIANGTCLCPFLMLFSRITLTSRQKCMKVFFFNLLLN